MSRSARLTAAAVCCALLAGWLTYRYTGSVAPDPASATVVVTSRELAAGSRISEAQMTALAVRRIPRTYLPTGAITDPAEAAGRRVALALPAGSYLTDAALTGGGALGRAGRLRAGERALTVDTVVAPAADELAAGDRVDLFASGIGGGQATDELITGAELLGIEPGADSGRARATLRLSAEQVSAVIRADVFARELRAVKVPE